jgi:uncharacterized protein YdaT
LKKQRGKAFNATLSDESEKEEEAFEEEKFLAFVALNEDKEDSQSYYSKNSEEEDMQSAYELQYVEFLKESIKNPSGGRSRLEAFVLGYTSELNV